MARHEIMKECKGSDARRVKEQRNWLLRKRMKEVKEMKESARLGRGKKSNGRCMRARTRRGREGPTLERNTLVYVFLVNSNSSIADFKSIYRYNDNINIIIVIIYDC